MSEENEYDIVEWKEVEPVEGYTQMCVWPSTIVENEDVENGKLDDFFSEAFKLTHPIRIVGCVKTLPDRDNKGKAVEGTGGRCDFMFFVHDEDLTRFAVPRLGFGIRWWEDVVGNKSHKIYPTGFLNYGRKVATW